MVLACDGEFGSFVGVRQDSIGDIPDGIVESLVESECSVDTQGLIGRTGRRQRVARCPCLSGHRTDAGHEEGHKVKERHDGVLEGSLSRSVGNEQCM